MARHGNGKIRKRASSQATAASATTTARTDVGDSDRVRLAAVRWTESKSTTPRFNDNPVYRAKAEYIRRIRGYTSPRGRISTSANIRFQSIVHRGTHERISEARRRLKHEPFDGRIDVPRAVLCDFNILHAHACGAYEVLNVREKPKEKSV